MPFKLINYLNILNLSMTMVKIMLNTNVYCRPFDDQSDDKIKDEANSALDILSQVAKGNVKIITSDVLHEEVDLIKDKSKRESVFYLVETVEKERISTSEDAVQIADELNQIIHDYNDCLHIAFAAISKCDFLLTCDNELLERKDKIERFLLLKKINTKIKNPFEYMEK